VSLAVSDGFQELGVLVAVAAVVADWSVVAGAVVIAGVAALQLVWARRPVPPAKKLGLTQLAVGLCVVAATAAGVLAWT
jgi:hypothetical protein